MNQRLSKIMSYMVDPYWQSASLNPNWDPLNLIINDGPIWKFDNKGCFFQFDRGQSSWISFKFFSSYFSGMDESISTVLTILCNHTFHSQCLAQWEDASCPVCRHVQTPEQVAEQKCFECQGSEDLWICLICGFVRTHHMFSRILKFLSVIVF